MLANLSSFASFGLHCERIAVEVGATKGDEPGMHIVGLGDTAVKESKQRVRMALRSSGLKYPSSKVITVNLAPADLRKSGPRYDLAIALGMMIIDGSQLVDAHAFEDMAFLGELALDGTLRHVTGVLPAAIACKKHGISTLVVPKVNAPEAALIKGLNVIGISSIRELVDVVMGEATPEFIPPNPSPHPNPQSLIDFADVRGQEHAKRALEIAAAGGHNVLLSGTPGSGKTLLARAFSGILPPLNNEESIEVTQIYSIANQLPADTPLIQQRPFRLIHHTASGVSIVGGGQIPKPGEITLAHRGVLFLDELAEFPAQVLEVLRQPLEDRQITITRAHGSVTFPADFIMVAAMNPPEFSAGNANKIQKRISKPLLDRIDLTIDVQSVPIEDLQKAPGVNCETSTQILKRVNSAREKQFERFKNFPISLNNEMNVKHIDTLCELENEAKELMKKAAEKMNISARAYHRVIKVARTIADLSGNTNIFTEHIGEALQYRQNIGL
ncbi:MAG: YifB family Mg chelatase-like AAA ATPase [Candidatus Peribacteraceae bacterium]|jgi:magnesium chelatase family protein|nr:YifB family Mg chelatase-like AAA ATPase [Candidatus Peribacteraceae bacterium]HCI04120.1 magnesium chelatase [Candidatus Peribacteria bacterium]